jgi:PhnB protein
MTTALNPYLNFRGNTREAMEFYEGVFGAKLTKATFADFGAATDESENDLVMHSDLEGPGGIRFMAADVPNRMDYQAGTNNFAMSLSGESGDEAELRGYFEKLSERGEVTQRLERAAWGDMFGMCNDRFGIHWLVNISAPKD